MVEESASDTMSSDGIMISRLQITASVPGLYIQLSSGDLQPPNQLEPNQDLSSKLARVRTRTGLKHMY
jgi:hypothetical protein